MAETQTAAERATAFAIEKFKSYNALRAEAERIYAAHNEAKGEFEWAMAHPALPEGFDPSSAVDQAPVEEKKPAAKRGRPRKAAAAPEAAPVAAASSATPVAEVQPSAPVAAPQAAPNPGAAPAAPVAQAPAAPVAAPPAGDFFDPFAGN